MLELQPLFNVLELQPTIPRPEHWPLQPLFSVLVVISALATTCMLCHLCRSPANVRRRLFWEQLLVLSLSDLLNAVFLFSTRYIQQQFTVKLYMQQVSIMLLCLQLFCEMCIAAGFASAAAGLSKAPLFLRPIMLVGIVAIAVAVNVNYFDVNQSHWSLAWDISIVVVIVATVLFYVFGVFLTLRMPWPVCRQALLRSASYVVGAAVTTWPLNFCTIFGGAELNTIVGCAWLYACSGAGNALVYAYWCRSGRRTRSLSAAEIESSMVLGFFELNIDEDEEALRARRDMALLVADVQHLHTVSIVSSAGDSGALNDASSLAEDGLHRQTSV